MSRKWFHFVPMVAAAFIEVNLPTSGSMLLMGLECRKMKGFLPFFKGSMGTVEDFTL